MKTLPYQVHTRVRFDDPVNRPELEELRMWLMENIGRAYVEWSTAADPDRLIWVKLRTEEQATLVALRWS